MGTLALYEHRDGVEVVAPRPISFDVARGEAHFGPVELAGPRALLGARARRTPSAPGALLSHAVVLDVATRAGSRAAIASTSRPGGIAYTHTHPGPASATCSPAR